MVKNNINDYSGIAIYAEQKNGKLHSVVPELIGIAKTLGKNLENNKIKVILLGKKIERLEKELFSYGVDQVLLVDKPGLDFFHEDSYTTLITEIIQEIKPEIFLGGATNLGRSIFPRVSAKLLTGLTADCTELEIDETSKLLKQTRPAFGGNVMATIITKNHRPQMATVRPNVFSPAIEDRSLEGEVIDMSYINIPASEFELIEYRQEVTGTKTLEEADVIVAVGRGIRGADSLPLINELTNKLNGAVAGSRAAVDAGWVPYHSQIGQTGKTVNPGLYLAFGISGAIQHVIGMRSSEVVVAINTDPNADIFKIADYGIVGNLFDVIPEMINRLNILGGINESN